MFCLCSCVCPCLCSCECLRSCVSSLPWWKCAKACLCVRGKIGWLLSGEHRMQAIVLTMPPALTATVPKLRLHTSPFQCLRPPSPPPPPPPHTRGKKRSRSSPVSRCEACATVRVWHCPHPECVGQPPLEVAEVGLAGDVSSQVRLRRMAHGKPGEPLESMLETFTCPRCYKPPTDYWPCPQCDAVNSGPTRHHLLCRLPKRRRAMGFSHPPTPQPPPPAPRITTHPLHWIATGYEQLSSLLAIPNPLTSTHTLCHP